jgi:hypothetical protein
MNRQSHLCTYRFVGCFGFADKTSVGEVRKGPFDPGFVHRLPFIGITGRNFPTLFQPPGFGMFGKCHFSGHCLVSMLISGDNRYLPPPLAHDIRSTLPDFEVISPLPEFGFQVSVFRWGCGSAFSNAALIISGAVLADMLEASTKIAVIVGGKFGEEGKDDALTVHSEDDDGGFGGFHWLVLSTEKTSVGSVRVAALALGGAAAI